MSRRKDKIGARSTQAAMGVTYAAALKKAKRARLERAAAERARRDAERAEQARTGAAS